MIIFQFLVDSIETRVMIVKQIKQTESSIQLLFAEFNIRY